MTLNLNQYPKAKDFIKFVIDNKNPIRSDIDVLSECCTVIHVPLICCLYYYMNLYGSTPEIQDKITFLKTFYGVTKIMGEENYVPKL